MATIVLTGAHGFIGTNLVEKLLSLEPKAIGFSGQIKPRFSNFKESGSAGFISLVISDLPESFGRATAKRFSGSSKVTYVDYENLFSHLEKSGVAPDMVIHNGACSSTVEKNPEVFERLNLGYTKKIWNYCTHHGVPLIYASSAAVYGDGELGFSDKKEDCAKYTPLNLYGKSKHDFDLWALTQENTPPSWFGLRYFNVYGPFEDHKGGQASMVLHGYNQAMQTGKIRLFKSNTPVYADGEQVRDFVFIDDIVETTLFLTRLSIERQHRMCDIFIPENGLFLNVGTGVVNSWNNLARCIFASIGRPSQIEYIPIPANIAGQYQNYTCANLTSLRSLGYDASFQSLSQGVENYVQKYLLRGMTTLK